MSLVQWQAWIKSEVQRRAQLEQVDFDFANGKRKKHFRSTKDDEDSDSVNSKRTKNEATNNKTEYIDPTERALLKQF
jgi:hypothetical protein